MKLFIVHTGYYDPDIGIYELHTNFMVVGKSSDEAKKIVKSKELFKIKKMHIDGIHEIEEVDGYKISVVEETASKCNDYKVLKELTWMMP